MKLVKTLLIVGVTLCVIGGLAWQFFLKRQVAYAEVATAYNAKMVCSCLHVAGRGMDSCREDFTSDMSVLSLADSGDTTTASILGGVVKSEARFEPGLGCTLVKS